MIAVPKDVGTGLASATDPMGPRYESLRMAHMRAVGADWVRRRPVVVLPMLAAQLLALLLAQYPWQRTLAVALLSVVNTLFMLSESWATKRITFDERRLFLSQITVMVNVAVVTAITGGMRSPLAPTLFAPAVSTLVAGGRSRASAITVAVTALEITVIALLPRSWSGPPVSAPWDVVMIAIALLFGLKMMYASVVKLTDSYHAAGDTLDRMREEMVSDALCRSRSLESIGAKVAHELKNPLATIKSLSQLMARCARDERATERLAVLRTEVSRMESILQDYLSFSRPLESLRIEPVDLGTLAGDVVDVLRVRAESARVSLRTDVAPVRVQGDARRLKEALINLTSNGLEATPEGGEVVLTVHETPEGAQVIVRDSGRGLDADQLAQVGTPFFTTRTHGTGLGVVLARTAVSQHGGTVSFQSEPGRGTTVTVDLPLTHMDERTVSHGAHPVGG